MQSEIWLNEGEQDERCFDVIYFIDPDEDYYGRTVPEITVLSAKENGVEIDDEQWGNVTVAIYDELYRIVENQD